MNLPQIDIPRIIFECDLKVSQQTIKFSPFVVDDEKGFLAAGKSKDMLAVIENFDSIIKPLIQTDIDLTKLAFVDILILYINFRCKSKDEIYSGKLKKCKHCGQPNIEFEIDILKSLKFINEDVLSCSYTVTDGLELKFKPIKRDFLFCAEKIKDEVDLYKYTIAHCIDMVIYNGEPYKDFTTDELFSKIISKMTVGQVSKAFDEISKMIQMYVELEIKCPNKKCGKTTSLIEKNFLTLLK